MKNDEFDRRVREFFESVPSPAAPDALRRLPGRLAAAEEGGPVRPTRVHRGPALAGMSMAGLVVAVLAVALILRFPGGQAASSGVPVGTASASPTGPATAGRAYALDGFAWQEIAAGTFDGVESLAFFPIDQGLLAVGTSRTAQVRLWLTGDGSSFQPLDASAFASDDPVKHQIFVDGVTHGPAGFVAVGGLLTTVQTGRVGPASPLVWQSSDGTHWSRLETQGLPASGLSYVAATDRGYVVSEQPDFTSTRIAAFPAYQSSDGVSWQATSVAAVKIVGHDGHVVALTSANAIAVSEAGSAWTTLHPASQVVALATSAQGFLATAYDQSSAKWTAMTSPDGHDWTSAGTTSTGLAAMIVQAVGRWMMVGQTSGGLNTIPILTSSDLLTWHSSAIPQQVIGSASLSSIPYPYREGFFAETQVELGPGGLTESGPLQVHLWWVRTAQAGDAPGATAPPEPTMGPEPTGGITEAKAIEVATARYAPMKGTTPYGKLVTIGGFDPKQTAVPPDRLVWAVMILVPNPECSPPPNPKPSACDLPYKSMAVLVDYTSGEIVEVLDESAQ